MQTTVLTKGVETIRADRNLMKLILENLRVNGCAICGSYYRLHFHHVDTNSRLFYENLGMTSKTNTDIATELNKCILLCQSCHTKVHWDGRAFDVMSKCNSTTKGLNSRHDI